MENGDQIRDIFTFLIDYLNSQPPGTNQYPSNIKEFSISYSSFNLMYKMGFFHEMWTFWQLWWMQILDGDYFEYCHDIEINDWVLDQCQNWSLIKMTPNTI